MVRLFFDGGFDRITSITFSSGMSLQSLDELFILIHSTLDREMSTFGVKSDDRKVPSELTGCEKFMINAR
jgi:hypothetical protein